MKYRIPIGSEIVRFSTTRIESRAEIERQEIISTRVATLSDADLLTDADAVRAAGGPFHPNMDNRFWRWFRISDGSKWTVFAVQIKFLEIIHDEVSNSNRF